MELTNFSYAEAHAEFIKFTLSKSADSIKRRRAFRNILFGLQKSAVLRNSAIRFLTLTTSGLMYDSEGYTCYDLSEHWRVLKARIQRLRPIDFERLGYLSHSEVVFYYGRDNLFKRFPFEYFKVITNEGNGVIHVLYRGWFLPYNWLVDNWFDIHLSWEVNIQLVSDLKGSLREVASYVVGQYVCSQDATYVRFSQSVNWVFRGFVTSWNDLKRSVFGECWFNSVSRVYFRHGVVVSRSDIWNEIYLAWKDFIYWRCFRQESLDIY
jgi:hypothetical protein